MKNNYISTIIINCSILFNNCIFKIKIKKKHKLK